MKTVTSGYDWILLENERSFYLYCICHHSCSSYIFSMQLNEDELNEYKAGGDQYLEKLAYDIHYSAPGVRGSNSKYRSRKADRTLEDTLESAIKESGKPFW